MRQNGCRLKLGGFDLSANFHRWKMVWEAGLVEAATKVPISHKLYLHNLHVWFILVLSISPPILSISSHILVHSQGICLLRFSDLDQSFKWDQHRIVRTSTIPRVSKFLAAAMKQYSEYSTVI